MNHKTLPPSIRWGVAMVHLSGALQAAHQMKTGQSDHTKDVATKAYVDEVDELVAQLDALQRDGHLAGVGAMLDAARGIWADPEPVTVPVARSCPPCSGNCDQGRGCPARVVVSKRMRLRDLFDLLTWGRT